MLKSEHDAEDVVQDSFIKVFTSISQIRNESHFSTWLYRIVYNESLRVIKKLGNPLISVDPVKDDEIPDYKTVDDTLQNLVSEERSRAITQVLDRLNQKESMILTLHYHEEKSIKEIHEISGLTLSNIKVILHRARKNIYSKLKKALH